MSASKMYVGVDLAVCANINVELSKAVDEKFDFMCVPLFHPRRRRDDGDVSDRRAGPPTRSDKLLRSDQWTTSVVGKVSEWIDLDSSDQHVRKNSEKAFVQEVNWAIHLAVPAIWIGAPRHDSCVNYARTIRSAIPTNGHTTLWVEIPLVSMSTMVFDDKDGTRGANGEDPWESWNSLRTYCDHHPSLGVVLVITENLPNDATCVLERWQGEPVKAVVLPTSIFVTNRSGYPTLPVAHQRFVIGLMAYKAQFVIRGKSRHADGLETYVRYMRYLNSEKRPKPTQQDEFESPYYDYLQMPLQPLMDNLESQTYETFEKDPIKYRNYEWAVRDALRKTPQEKTTVIMVVGAGRGPLVQASLRASASAKRRVKVFAVEKNPNAIITLRNLHVDERWGDRVTIVESDMRRWSAPQKADILVSELLGSFGDNELSPECLDGAQSFLKRDTGISIPCDSTSYITPITSSKLWNEVAKFKELKHLETPYVVKMHNYAALGDVQECFRFVHPNWSKRIDNRRFVKLTFKARFNATIHGFAGYFHSNLYGSHAISINPSTVSEGMFSWFPIYFPIRTPVYVETDQAIEFCVWRCVSTKKVWYEWAMTSPVKGPIHNPNGRSYWIGL